MGPFWEAVFILIAITIASFVAGFLIRTVFPVLNFWQGAAAGLLWVSHVTAIYHRS
jgi:hypothetical protein